MTRPRVSVPDGYRCPLCPGHADPVFDDSPLVVGQPICAGCSVELKHHLTEDTRRDDDVLDRLEAFTGRSFEESRVLYLRELVLDLEDRLSPTGTGAGLAEDWAGSYGQTADSIRDDWRRLLASAKKRLALREMEVTSSIRAELGAAPARASRRC